MEIDQGLRPSTLYSRFKDNPISDGPIDYESLLFDLLLLLSSLEDIDPHFASLSLSRNDDVDHRQDFELVTWISNQLQQEAPLDIDNIIENKRTKERNLFFEWSTALVYIHDLSQHIAPFELHFLASQSILLSENPIASHRILCLLLCSHALRQCPELRNRRWKRWQSLVCETIRIFQDSIPILEDEGARFDSGMSAFSLLVHHIVPSCLHVIAQLPLEDSYHVAIFAGLIGTSSKILGMIVALCQEEQSKGSKDTHTISAHFQAFVSTMHETLQSVVASFHRFGVFSANTLWIESMTKPLDKEVNRNEDVDFRIHRDRLSWWIHHRQTHEPEERIANMDTSFDNTGLGLLAMKAFQERPLVYNPRYLWTIWYPHVALVFRKSAIYPSILRNLAFHFLESLVEIIPQESLVPEILRGSIPDVNLELFHLLSNQLMSRVKQTKDNDADSEAHEEYDFKERSQRTVALIKAVLTRFTTRSQVQIIEKVIQTCSSPGLKARFLDLLRPLILVCDEETERLLWELFMSIVQDMFQKFWNRKKQVLVNVDDLMNRDVEISVGAITMIQMWSLVEGKMLNEEQAAMGKNLQEFHIALQKLLARWAEHASDAPDFHYRLFLLDIALQNTCESLSRMTC